MASNGTILSQPWHTRGLTHARHYRWYVLSLLWMVAVLRFVDMQILAVLLEPIKQEFQLSDTQLSLLGGFAFALFYGSLGLPIAWLADRYNRRNIIAIAVAFWSLMTALCGQASSFATLFLARMGVGMGEAGAYPPSTSLLADYFKPKERSHACAILASAIPMGVFIGFMVGGVVAQYWGWRAAFAIVGLPGVALGLLVYLTVKEPQRGACDEGELPSGPPESFRTSIEALWDNSAYRYVVLGACLFTLGAAGSGIWMPSFFMRHHGLELAQTGFLMALLYGGGGMLGALTSGWLANLIGTRTTEGLPHASLCCLSLALVLPVLPIIFLVGDTTWALSALGIMTILMHINSGPVLALLQQLAGCQRRAMAHAVSMLVSNLVALPLGPLFVGLCSDYFGERFGSATLGYAILALLLLAWSSAAWCFYFAGKVHGAAACSA
jgi:predicted MFS family arabinose efflux permease